MKNKPLIYATTFLIFGMSLISSITWLSITRYIKDLNFNNQQSFEKTLNSKEESKISHIGKEETLQTFFVKPDVITNKVFIKVYKNKRIMELYGDGKLIGRFKVALGRSPEGEKEQEGDNRTPEGSYYICSETSQTKYTYFMGLSYPNIKDAQRALDKGIIDKNTYLKIQKAIEYKEQPPWNTPLGGSVGIHGGSNKYDWTYGCIALSDDDMKILKQYAQIKTIVEIYK